MLVRSGALQIHLYKRARRNLRFFTLFNIEKCIDKRCNVMYCSKYTKKTV